MLQQRLTVLQLVHPDDRQRVEAVIDRHVEDRNSREFLQEFRIQTSRGELRWVDCRMLVQRDAQGVATHLQGVLLDITEKIRLREQAAQARPTVSAWTRVAEAFNKAGMFARAVSALRRADSLRMQPRSVHVPETQAGSL